MEFAGRAGQRRATEDGSSSPALSSPPRTPDNATPPNAAAHHDPSRDKSLGVFNPALATSQPDSATTASNLTSKGQPRKKPGRKPKDPNAPPAPPKPRKRVKTSEPGQTSTETATAPKQPKITELVGSIQAPPPPAISATGQPQSVHNHTNSTLGHSLPSAPPRPASSGQIFDPVRGSTVPVESTHHATAHAPVSPNQPMQLSNRASASPSIKSLIDPNPAIPAPSSRFAAPSNITSAPVTPSQTYKQPSTSNSNPFTGPAGSSILQFQPQAQPQSNIIHPTPMEIDSKPNINTLKKTETVSTAPSSNAPTPPPQQKAPRAKEQPPPLPTGSGLLSATPFGPGALATNGSSTTTDGTNIYLTFELKGKQNTTINYAREVERKYGFAALHPRLAARKERQRQLAAAGAALEKELGVTAASGDDMSLDISEPPSEEEMPGRLNGNGNGGDETGSAAGTGADGAPKKRRRRRIEEYDRTDDFIDDTELLWEESALMAKDGFFVYSGPLVVEGAKMDVERSDGTVSKRGRGRGRGGAGTGAGATRGETSGRGSRGGGRGSRGGATVRKPRVTKADRAMMELEKVEREKMAATLAAKPAATGGATQQQTPLHFPMAGASAS